MGPRSALEELYLVAGERQAESHINGRGHRGTAIVTEVGLALPALLAAARLDGKIIAFAQTGPDLPPQLIPGPAEVLGLPQPEILLWSIQ